MGLEPMYAMLWRKFYWYQNVLDWHAKHASKLSLVVVEVRCHSRRR